MAAGSGQSGVTATMSTQRSDPDDVLIRALERALRAELSAEQAHERLDRMNGSIDHLTDEVRVVAAGVARIDHKLAAADGVVEGRGQIITPARSMMLAMAGSVLSAVIVKVL